MTGAVAADTILTPYFLSFFTIPYHNIPPYHTIHYCYAIPYHITPKTTMTGAVAADTMLTPHFLCYSTILYHKVPTYHHTIPYHTILLYHTMHTMTNQRKRWHCNQDRPVAANTILRSHFLTGFPDCKSIVDINSQIYVHIALYLDGLQQNFSSRHTFSFKILPEPIIFVCMMYQWFVKTYSSNLNSKKYEEAAFDSVSVFLDWLWPKSWLADVKLDDFFFCSQKNLECNNFSLLHI